MRACVTEARATVYVCVHMPKECVCERKDVRERCRKKLAAQQRRNTNVLVDLHDGNDRLSTATCM